MAALEPNRPSPEERPRSLDELVDALGALDAQLLHAMNERAELTQAIAKVSCSEGESSFDPYAEWDRIAELTKQSEGPLQGAPLHHILRELISGCRSLSVPIRAAFLGPAYSYSYLAAVERFGQSVELTPVATIGAVFEEVSRGTATYGLVPIENSTDGRIADTFSRFAQLPVRICAEVQLRIHHCLLGRSPRDEVQEIYSKPQALSQCRDWLATHMPQARLHEIASTTAAAELAAKQPGVAAIASRQAGTAFGLDCLAANIEDNPHNVTRFAVLGGAPARPTGADKTALMFEVKHQPGALAEVMGIFQQAGLNLTWIESFPLPGKESEYFFFIELVGHQQDPPIAQALEQLQKVVTRLEVLGSYAQTEPVG